ncbi:LysR family transcriptional regulator [Janthinobacterium sp.]|uniref:LysR family transcriptional regulator n=1 Tax=Janthinobacterium sp. TaxID=1871054 RepID=UPI00293D3559|nr:LysR family transcriptional regulator [Janthinobacterium sp.]
MRKLDTHGLQMFVAVALCLNFRQAAQQLHMTQPPLSRAIKALEARLGVRLFERDTRGVALTPAAVHLLPQARQILALLDRAEASMAAARAPAGLRLGLTSSVEAGMFRPFTAALGEALGAGGPELTFAPSPRLVAAVRAGRLDAAVIALPCQSFELELEVLGRQALMLALPSGHRLARRRSVALAELNGEAVYWFERARQPAFFDHCHAVFRRHGFAPAFLREPLDHHVLLSDIASGKGVALLAASFTALRLNGVCYRKLAQGEELGHGIGLVTGADGHAATAALRRLARAHLAPAPPPPDRQAARGAGSAAAFKRT